MTKKLLRLTILIFALAVITLSSLGCELQDEIGKITDIFDISDVMTNYVAFTFKVRNIKERK